MKAFVTHDRDGALLSLIVGPSDGPPAAITTEPGLHVAELDAPKRLVELFRDQEPDEEKILDVLKEYKVDFKTDAKLVRRKKDSGTS